MEYSKPLKTRKSYGIPSNVRLLRLPRDALGIAQGQGVDSSRWRQWTVLRKITMIDMPGTAINKGLWQMELKLSLERTRRGMSRVYLRISSVINMLMTLDLPIES